MVFKIISGSSDLILTFNILIVVNAKSTLISIVNRLFLAKCSSSSWSVFEKSENPIGVSLVSC
jgi:hypothetical protein